MLNALQSILNCTFYGPDWNLTGGKELSALGIGQLHEKITQDWLGHKNCTHLQ